MKKKNIAALMAAAMMCSSAIPFASALEDGRTTLPQSFTNGTAVSVCSTKDIVIVLKSDSTLWASGRDLKTFYSPFTQIAENVKSFYYTCDNIVIIKNDDTLWTATLSNLKTTGKFEKKLENVRSIIIDASNALAIKTDNTLWGWGTDIEKQTFPIDVKSLPSNVVSTNSWRTTIITPVKMMDNVQEIASSFDTTLFLKTDGTLYGIGSGRTGQLGESVSENEKDIIIPIKLMSNVKHIADAGRASYAITNDNALWGWGCLPWQNDDENQRTPIKLAENVKSAQEANGSLVYVTTDGSIWGYGDVLPGCEGNSKNVAKKSTLTNVSAIFGNIYDGHELAITTDGSLWACGSTGMRTGGDETNNFYDVYNCSQYGKQLTDYRQIMGVNKSTTTTPTAAPASTATAKPTNATVMVNGKQIAFDAYNINNNNYFKLRDIAKVLSGSDKQFEVTWNGSTKSIELKPGSAYTSVGGELVTGKAKQQTAKLSSDKVYMNGSVANLTAYTINGNNYFKLRDLGKLLNFGVDWDGTAKCISINSSTAYTE